MSEVAPLPPVVQNPNKPGKIALWVGRIIGGLPALMLLAGGVTDILKLDFVVEELTKAGYSEGVIVPLGVVTTLSALLYFIPQTAVLGGVLLTAYLGGAVCHHVHAGDPLGMVLAPAIFAIPLWLGLLLREPRLRALLPWRNN